MTNQELKKLRRQDLLEILLEQSQEIERLNKKLRKAEERLSDRQIQLEEAGSIADAALRINGVFGAAQEAAKQYLDNIQNLSSRQEAICAKREEESLRASENRLLETEKRCQQMEIATNSKCEKMLSDAEQQVQERWTAFQTEIRSLTQLHQESDCMIHHANEEFVEGGHLDEELSQ